jgi:tripartite-type tricarboxylate transporter receptor subunit TctC
LAVTTSKPVPQAPDIPAVGELGYPGLIAENFVGLSGPAGLPAAVSQRLNDVIAQTLASADIRARLEGQGFVLAQKSPAEFTDFVRRQAAAWGPVVRATGASL